MVWCVGINDVILFDLCNLVWFAMATFINGDFTCHHDKPHAHGAVQYIGRVPTYSTKCLISKLLHPLFYNCNIKYVSNTCLKSLNSMLISENVFLVLKGTFPKDLQLWSYFLHCVSTRVRSGAIIMLKWNKLLPIEDFMLNLLEMKEGLN